MGGLRVVPFPGWRRLDSDLVKEVALADCVPQKRGCDFDEADGAQHQTLGRLPVQQQGRRPPKLRVIVQHVNGQATIGNESETDESETGSDFSSRVGRQTGEPLEQLAGRSGCSEDSGAFEEPLACGEVFSDGRIRQDEVAAIVGLYAVFLDARE